MNIKVQKNNLMSRQQRIFIFGNEENLNLFDKKILITFKIIPISFRPYK